MPFENTMNKMTEYVHYQAQKIQDALNSVFSKKTGITTTIVVGYSEEVDAAIVFAELKTQDKSREELNQLTIKALESAIESVKSGMSPKEFSETIDNRERKRSEKK